MEMKVTPRRFVQCDVFSPVPLQGNGLAVVVDAEGISEELMQRVAAWTNLSETTYLLPPTDPSADYRVRIFTAAQELPFAGHPTLGSCASWLQCGGVPKTPGIVRQECGIGIIEVDITQSPLYAFAAPRTTIKTMDPLQRTGITQVLGLSERSIVDTVELCNGPTWQLFELEHASDVLAVDASRLKWPEFRFVGLFGPHDPGSECDYEARMFGFSNTMLEDPITGSLNAAIAQWMHASGRLQKPYRVAQGTRLGRSGRVTVKPGRDGMAWIGGQVHILIEGKIHI